MTAMNDREGGPGGGGSAPGSHPPMTHAAALDWCASRHPKAGVPKSTCPGPLRLAGSAAGLPGSLEGAEVSILHCEDCGAELAIGRGTTAEARVLAPALHGRLLWVSRPGDAAFDYVDPEFTHLAHGPDGGPAPADHVVLDASGVAELSEALEELQRSGVEIAGLARGLIDQVDRQGRALGRLEGLIGPLRSTIDPRGGARR